MKKYLTILMVVLVLIMIGYFIKGQSSFEPPTPTITVEGNQVTTAQGSYCWSGLFNSKCVDMISPPEIIKHQKLKPIAVSPQAQMKIEYKKEPKKDTMKVYKWISNQETEAIQLKDNVFLAPKEKGIYVYDVSARWEKGSSSSVFVIEVR